MTEVSFICWVALFIYLGLVWLVHWPLTLYWNQTQGKLLQERIRAQGAQSVGEELAVPAEVRGVRRGVRLLLGVCGWLLVLGTLPSLPPVLGVIAALSLIGIDFKYRIGHWHHNWLRTQLKNG